MPSGNQPAVLVLAIAFFSGPAPGAAELPVPCLAGSCGANAAKWVGAGTATASQSGNALTINQTSQSVILNWKSFNVSADGTVTFKQPTATAVALNEIFQSDPSKILGALHANGSIYLINQNGIIFGAGSQVSVGTLIASSLDITPQAMNGILNASLQTAPAFTSFVDSSGNPLPSGPVTVQAGANLQAPGGQIMLFAPQVQNSGTIRADGGQVILAAGDQVYLAASSDPNLRGLLVEVGTGGTVTNTAASGSSSGGQIAANLGDVTMVGLIVNQLGRVSATTSVSENGSIHLLAQDGGGVASTSGTSATLFARSGGTLTLGPGSHTDVLLDTTDTGMAVDQTPQPQSAVILNGQQVVLQSGSEVTATSGNVSVVAANNPTESNADYTLQPGNGRLVIEAGAGINVSGANIQEPVSDNVIAVQLRGTELADSPLQRNGPLRGQTVYVDVRQTGTFDGTPWVGSPIGDLSGYVATIERTVAQRSLTGGTISLQSDGAVLDYAGSTLNVSGGSIQYLPGFVNTTKVLGTNGIVYDISQADPNISYVGIVGNVSVTNPKWGTTQTYPTSYAGQYESGYVEGKDAGAVDIVAPTIALDGTINASTVVGPYQRQLPTAIPAGSLYRPVNQIPLGGELTVGLNQNSTGAGYLVDNVTFAAGDVLNGLTGPGGAPFNPLTDPLPPSLSAVQLRPNLIGDNAVSQLEVFANGQVSIPAGVDLQFPVAGELSVTAGSVDIGGRIRAPSGSVAITVEPTIALLANPTLTLEPSAVLDVSGYLVNDLPAGTATARTDPLAIQGGSVYLAASNSPVSLESGSLIDVSGGAQLTSGGQINAGSAGGISISVAPYGNFNPVPVTLDATLRGFALENGGHLSIAANSICIAATDCTAAQMGSLWIAPSLFTADGFSQINLTSNLGGLDLAPGTLLNPRQLNFDFTAYPSSDPTGTPLGAFAVIALQPDLVRNPESVSFSTNVAGFPGVGVPEIDSGNMLEIGQGSAISLDPRGSLSLASNTSIIVDGALSAPAGNITVSTTTSLPVEAFLPNQGIWLEPGAQLSTQGVALTQINDQGLITGSVLAGGDISIIANRGYLITTPQSTLNASGTSATLDLLPASTAGHAPVATQIGSAGGTITLTASEGMLLNGTVLAPGGAGQGTAGGTLNVTFDGSLHADPSFGAPIFPENPHQMIVSNSAPIIVAPGYAVPEAYNGVAMVPAQMINGGGFSSVQLSVPNEFGPPESDNAVVSFGSIAFPNSVVLSVAGSLRLDTPQIAAGPGAQVSLSSAYVGLGYDDTREGSQLGGISTPGTGVLKVNGDLVELIGTLGLSGFASTDIVSTGDIRLRGVQTEGLTPILETLQAQGSLTLQAAQVYPTTLTQATIDVAGAASELQILPGGAGAPVLSAGGELTLQATTIAQGGVLRAPFGQITLDATDITLSPGSVTSVAGSGQTVPFGETQAGTDWVYTLPEGETTLYTASGPPVKSVVLNANSINVAHGATVDVSGGGDMQAYEFVPGTGGTNDVLANSYNPAQFAIVPQSGLSFAPYDPQASMGFSYAIGSSVVLGAGSGVPAGTYAILPARYALLPGAFLVTPVAGYANLAPGQGIAQSDGSVVVAGRFTQAGNNILQATTEGFDIAPQSLVNTEAQYNLTSANAFFSALAAANKTTAPQLPQDAGSLALLAGQQLQFLGSFADSAAAGGRGGLVDISATQIEITDGTSAGAPGVVAVNAGQLNALNAQSLLIGGTRQTDGANGSVTDIETSAATISVDPNVKLTGSDLILAATGNISLGAGAVLQATGAPVSVPAEYDLAGDGALLRVSNGPQVPIFRSSFDNLSGTMTLSAGSVLMASGSVTLDATGNLSSQAGYDVQHGSLAFQAPQISLGSSGNIGGQLVLSSTELSSLDLAALSLTSASSIDVYGPNTLTIAGSLTLNAGLIDAATTNASATLQAHTITLNGSNTSMAPGSMNSSGGLTLQSNVLSLNNAISLSGFAFDSLTGEATITAQSTGSLTAGGPLNLHTALLAGATGVNFQFSSSGAVQVLGADGGGAASTMPAGAGVTLGVTGSSVEINTGIVSPSGTVQLTANGAGAGDGVVLGSSSVIDLSGSAVNFDGVESAGPGGRLLVSSAAGNFTQAAGSHITLNAGGPGAAAGVLDVSVPQGTAILQGTLSAQGDSSGEFLLDAAQLPDLGPLNASLNAGGFSGLRSFRQRGLGDVIVPALAGAAVNASSVSIEADGGSVDVQGTIDATGSSGGLVTLAAQNGVYVEGSILAAATQAGQNGGSLQIAANNGTVQVAGSALVDLSGAPGGSPGTISLQVPRSSLTGMLGGGSEAVSLGGTYRGNPQVLVEGLAAYVQSSGVISAADEAADLSNPFYADAVTFMQNATAIGQAVAGHSNLSVSVVPGIDIESPGDLTIADAWDLSNWRFNGVPGILTLRAAGNLLFDQSLSDGFSGASGPGAFVLPETAGPSWSYRLVAGADLSAANPLTVLLPSALPSGEGNLMIAAGQIDGGTNNRPPDPTMIRTGTGNIDIAAAGNLEFGNRASVIYTAGQASSAGIALPGLQDLAYPTAGGDISINVGGNILGAATNQLVNSWLWRTGQDAAQISPSATGWTVSYQWFEENVGALAGGNVRISAGGDVSELSVAIPNIGVQVGGTSAAANLVQVTGGGALSVQSGGNITGGSYYVGSGSGNLFAWGGIGEDLSNHATATGHAPLIALGDATIDVSAIGAVQIESALNPMLLPQGRVQPFTGSTESYFSTYSDDSAVNLLSVAADVTLLNDVSRPGGPVSQLTSMSFSTGSSVAPFNVYPGTFSATALSGNVIVGGTSSIALWPAPTGNLNLFADLSVEFPNGAALTMPDFDPATLPNPNLAVRGLGSNVSWQGLFVAPVPGTFNVPIHSAAFSPTGVEDPEPARIVALTGDVSDAILVFVPKPIHVIAGQDIVDLSLLDEQLSAADLSIISAGGNINFPEVRDPVSGALLNDGHSIIIEGPGSLSMLAGGSINLGTSQGIITAGNLYNPALPPTGANVSVVAGATVAQADIAAFTNQYLVSESTYDPELIAFVELQTSQVVATKAQALQLYESLSQEQQFELSEQILFDELRTGGAAAAAPGPLHDNYTSSFAALATLFPESTSSNPTTGAAATYPGNISMYFSQIYTLDGGNISLLAPGGFVNVGISTPPASFGVAKSPDQLGLVAQGAGNVTSVSFGDFEVNQSRVFAADGGNILVWSTDGNIDAGRGAKTAISAPAPTVTFSPSGQVQTVFPAALTGSGIQALATTPGVFPGNVDLFAPQGVVNANDAGIVAGNLTIGATAVLGRDNITVSGVAVGLPPDTSGLGASLASSSAVASSATSAETLGVNSANGAERAAAPLSENALSWLDVFVTGLGEENCKPDDTECLKRQKIR